MKVERLPITPQKDKHDRGGAFGPSESPLEGASATTASFSSDNMATPDGDRRQAVHLRSNFSVGYLPPDVQSSHLPETPPSIPRRTAWSTRDDDDLQMHEPPRISSDIPSDEDAPDDEVPLDRGSFSTPSRVPNGDAYDRDANHTKPTIDPPRSQINSVTPPEISPGVDSAEWGAQSTELEYRTDGPETPYEEFNLSPGSSTEGLKRPPPILKSRLSPENDDDDDDDDDDDSLFDFEEEKRNTQKMRRSSLKKSARGRRKSRSNAEEDDTSLEQDYGIVRERSSSLQERAQQAWASRNQRSHSNPSTKRSAKEARATEATVSFGKNHTVHHFETGPAYDDEDTHATINSTYSKSMESEMEDLFKDLLFVDRPSKTKPGRRMHKDRRRPANDDGTLDDTTYTQDDSTLNTLDDALGEDTTYTENASKGASSRETYSTLDGEEVSLEPSETVTEDMESEEPSRMKTLNEDEDTLSALWDYMEGGVSAVGLALGLSKDSETKEEKITAESTREVKSPSESDTTKESKTTSTLADTKPAEKETEEGPFDEMINYASGLFFGAESDEKSHEPMEANNSDDRSILLEEDDRLDDLAMHAVRAKHVLNDVVFDETSQIDIVTEIKFCVVKLALPLGILFHENEGGCWVTKIFEGGNAAKSGDVTLGDQLAAINGVSSISMKVDEICSLITESPDQKEIELTLVRYTGPLHPVAAETKTEASGVSKPKTSMFKRKNPRTAKAASEKISNAKSTVNNKDPAKSQATNSKRFRLFGRKKKH